MSMIYQDISIALALLAGLALALEIGFRAGRRATQEGDSKAGAQLGSIQGAIIGLLGLLLGFSFAAAGSRFLERQDLIVREANAIGTATLRSDLLPEPHRSNLRGALQRYTQHRLELSQRLGRGIGSADAAEIDRLHARMWRAAADGVAAAPGAMLVVVPAVNEVIDVHSLRVGAGRKHLPPLVLWLLIGCSVLSVAVIGYGCGTGKRRRGSLTTPLTLMIWAALWITIDLDHPRAGLMRLSDAPLESLRFDPPAP